MSKSTLNRMKKGELIEELTKRGYSDLDKLKRPQLLEMIKGDIANNALESAKPQDDEQKDTTNDDSAEEEVTIPSPSDPEWTQYVLSQFVDDELEGQNPKVDGLRRVTEKLLGDIIEENCDLIEAPHERNQYRACVKASITLFSGKRFSALADAYPGNIPASEFAVYCTALADTRAKGRCFRNALKLRQVVSAEELSDKFETTINQNEENITKGQITLIRQLTDRHNIVISKLLERLEIPYNKSDSGGVDLNQLKKENAISVLQELSRLRSMSDIPNSLKRKVDE